MERIEVSVMDRHLVLSVDSNEKEKLLAAVQHANGLMEAIKRASPNLSTERIAIMASIKLASDMMHASATEGPFKGVQFGDFQRKMSDINSLLEAGLNHLKPE